jgi:ATP-dependent DNA helicase DinG
VPWRRYFPFPEWRDQQAQALDLTVERYHQFDDILIEAATGIGKSGLAVALARWRSSLGYSTYVTTATVYLEDQYVRDFYRFGLRQLHGKSKYHCEEFQSCDLGSATIETPGGKKRKRCRTDACPYQLAKKAFAASGISISNVKYILTCARFIKGWPQRELAIFDEAHGLHEDIADNHKIEIFSRSITEMPSVGGELEWLREYYLHHLSAEICELDQKLLDTEEEDDQELARLVARLDSAGRKLQNIVRLLGDDPREWAFDHQHSKLIILPVWAKRLAQELLPRIGRKRIYLSATLTDPERQMKYLGIDPAKATFISLPSPFQVENRLIHSCPMVKWTWPDQTPGVVALCEATLKVLKRHPDERGLIHVSSYPQAHSLVARMRHPRLVTHQNADDREEALKRCAATPRSVLVSPSCHEGVDLHDDLSRFQIVGKLPKASIGDERVRRRIATDPSWYGAATTQRLIQACGRSVRGETDYAVTYVVDAEFDKFVGKQRRLFPEYFLDAIRRGEVSL